MQLYRVTVGSARVAPSDTVWVNSEAVFTADHLTDTEKTPLLGYTYYY